MTAKGSIKETSRRSITVGCVGCRLKSIFAHICEILKKPRFIPTSPSVVLLSLPRSGAGDDFQEHADDQSRQRRWLLAFPIIDVMGNPILAGFSLIPLKADNIVKLIFFILK